MDYTKFYIRLYKNNNINNNERGILVEIQRVDGDSFKFHQVCTSILEAVKGGVIDERKEARRCSSISYIPASILSHRTQTEMDGGHHPKEANNAEYMMHVEELLKNDRSDAVLLGIESLLVLTDQERSQVCLDVANAVINGNGHSVIKDFIHNCIFSPSSTFSPEDNEFDYASRQRNVLHNISLAILGNSLETVSDAKECPILRSLLQSEEWMGSSGIVDLLLTELSQCEDRAHDAYHAARCLNTLLDSSPGMKNELIERGLPNVVKVSRRVGRCQHSLLAHECDKALELISR